MSEEISVLLRDKRGEIVCEWGKILDEITNALNSNNNGFPKKHPSNADVWFENLFASIIYVINDSIEYSSFNFTFQDCDMPVDDMEVFIDRCINIIRQHIDVNLYKRFWHLKNYILSSYAFGEHKRMTERLEKRDILINGLGVFLIIINEDMDVLWANKQATTLFPSLEEDFSCYNTPLCKCNSPTDKDGMDDEECQDCLCNIMRTSLDSLPKRIRMCTHIDSEQYFEVCSTRLQNNTILVLGYDVTSYVASEEKYDFCENKINFLLENSRTGMLLLDSDGTVISTNHHFSQIMSDYGSTLQKIEGKFFWDVVDEDDRDAIQNLWNEIPQKQNLSITAKCCGEIFDLKFMGIVNGVKKFIGALVTIDRDLNMAEIKERLDDGQQVCGAIIDMIEDSILVIDDKYNVVIKNSAAQRLFGDMYNLQECDSFLANKLCEIIKNNNIDENNGVVTDIDDKEYLEVTISKLSYKRIIVYMKSLYPVLTSLKQQVANKDKEMKMFSDEFNKLMQNGL